MTDRSIGGAAASAAALILMLFGAVSCSDSTKASDWNVSEDSQGGFPVRQGIYRGEFEVINDGCEPSLAELIERRDDFPLPQMPLWVDEPGRYAQTNAYSWRDAHLVRVGFLLDPLSMAPVSEPAFTWQWLAMTGFDHKIAEEDHPLACTVRGGESAVSWLEVTQPARDTIRVAVEADWSDVASCVEDVHYEIFPTLPVGNCRESYVATYTLETPCPSPCEIDVGGSVHAGLSSNGQPGFYYSEPPKCVCPDEDEARGD